MHVLTQSGRRRNRRLCRLSLMRGRSCTREGCSARVRGTESMVAAWPSGMLFNGRRVGQGSSALSHWPLSFRQRSPPVGVAVFNGLSQPAAQALRGQDAAMHLS